MGGPAEGPGTPLEDPMTLRSGMLLSLLALLAPAGASATLAAPAVPEPTGLALFAAGAATVVVAARLRRNR